MSTTYAQKFSTIPKVSEKKGAFILDESSQSKCLQRKIDLINNTVRREDISSNNFIVQRSVKRYFNSRRKYSRNHRAREKNHSRSYMYFAKIDYRNPYTDNFKDRHLGNSIIDALEKSAERLSKNPDIFKNHVILPKTGLKFKLAKELIPVICNKKQNLYRSKNVYTMLESKKNNNLNIPEHNIIFRHFEFGVTKEDNAIKISHFQKPI